MATLYYQGHGSYRIITGKGTVLYVDPYAGDGYDVPADLILVTHEHGDHNQVQLVPQKPGCVIWRAADLLKDGVYQTLTCLDIKGTGVEAYNKNHPKDACVGCVLELDGLKIYASGDTSRTEDMEKKLPALSLDYALLPTDGIYNMGPEEASACAALIGAKHTIPIHTNPKQIWDAAQAEKLVAPGRLLVAAGETIRL